MLKNIKIELKDGFFWVTTRYSGENHIWMCSDIYEAFNYLLELENKLNEKELI